jgi:hypothetical protein
MGEVGEILRRAVAGGMDIGSGQPFVGTYADVSQSVFWAVYTSGPGSVYAALMQDMILLTGPHRRSL